MEITWHGNTCFTLKEKKTRIVINPDKKAKNLKGEIVLHSLKEEPAKIEGALKMFTHPGEYEVRDIPITGFQAWTKSKSKEEEEGRAGDSTIIFYFEMGGIKIGHLGELGHVLTSEMVKQIGDVDILMIDLGDKSNLNIKKAREVVESMEPRILIPMGEGDIKEALKELGSNGVEAIEKYEIKSRSELPEDKRLYVLLKKV